MLPSNPAQPLRTAPVSELVALLLKQFKRLLADKDITLTTDTISAISEAAAQRATTIPQATALQTALVTLVEESQTVLQERFSMTFEQALAADMSAVGGWETTAEFLDIANHKSNAELRISTGSSLLTFIGDTHFVEHLWTVISDDAGAWDVDASFAQRALCHLAAVNPEEVDWEAQVRAWLDENAAQSNSEHTQPE